MSIVINTSTQYYKKLHKIATSFATKVKTHCTNKIIFLKFKLVDKMLIILVFYTVKCSNKVTNILLSIEIANNTGVNIQLILNIANIISIIALFLLKTKQNKNHQELKPKSI